MTTVLLFIRTVDTEISNRLLVINFQTVQPQAISVFYNSYVKGRKVRLSNDMVKSFDGEANLMAWLMKVKLVARLQKIPDLASFISQFLEGDPLALYLQLSEEDQLKAGKIETKLQTAFIEGTFFAYARLGKMRWPG